MLKIIPLILVISCGLLEKTEETNEVSVDTPVTLEEIEEIRANYCELSLPLFEENNFIVSKCDGLLFASLHNIACGFPSLGNFEGETGQWFRSLEHDCKGNGADSDSSKDMIQGWFLNMALTENRSEVREFLDFTIEHDGFFCTAIDNTSTVSKCLLPPTTLKIMRDFYYQLPAAESELKLAEGFKAHLQVLRQLQTGVVYGAISKIGLAILKKHKERQPENALYVASHALFSDGNMTQASRLIGAHCPKERLPTSDDRCTDYLYQREKSAKDWDPCEKEPKDKFFGTDCLFAAAVVLGKVK